MPRGVGALDEARLQGRLWSPRVLNPTWQAVLGAI